MAYLLKSIDRHVGTCLRVRREHLALSQADVADALATTAEEVELLETGAKRISAERIRLLARLLDVGPAFFYRGFAGTLH